MKHLKTYESWGKVNLTNGPGRGNYPRVGNYVICVAGNYVRINRITIEDKHKYFIENNIGRIVKRNVSLDKDVRYKVEYDNYPDYMEAILNDFWVDKYEIIYFSKNRQECEEKLEDMILIKTSDKYNL